MRILVYSLCILVVLSADGTVKAAMTSCKGCVNKDCNSPLKSISCSGHPISKLVIVNYDVQGFWNIVNKQHPELEHAANYDACLTLVVKIGANNIPLRGCINQKLKDGGDTCKFFKLSALVVSCTTCSQADCNVTIRHPPLKILYYIISTVVSLKLLF